MARRVFSKPAPCSSPRPRRGRRSSSAFAPLSAMPSSGISRRACLKACVNRGAEPATPQRGHARPLSALRKARKRRWQTWAANSTATGAPRPWSPLTLQSSVSKASEALMMEAKQCADAANVVLNLHQSYSPADAEADRRRFGGQDPLVHLAEIGFSIATSYSGTPISLPTPNAKPSFSMVQAWPGPRRHR